jgi:hypothetical protein
MDNPVPSDQLGERVRHEYLFLDQEALRRHIAARQREGFDTRREEFALAVMLVLGQESPSGH